MKNGVKRFACLLVALALVSGLFAGLAEVSQPSEVDFTLDQVNIFGVGENVPNQSNGDIVEKDKKTEEKTVDKLTAGQTKTAQKLNNKVADLDPVTGTFKRGGKTYYELLNGTVEEKKQKMKEIESRDLFYELLTKPTQGSNGKSDIFYSVWLPVASAALRGGGVRNYYWVDDDWSPETFHDAFIDWDSTYCTRKSTPSSFTDGGYRNWESGGANKYKYAQSFREVGEWMQQSVKEHSDYVYKGLSGNMSGYDKILTGWKAPDYKGDIFFVPFTSVIHRGASGDESSGHIGYAWDCFAVCFYDFKLKPISELLKTPEEGSPSYYYDYTHQGDKSVMLGRNESAEAVNFSASKTDSEATTTSTTLSTSHTISYTESGNFSYSYGFGITNAGLPTKTVTFGVSFASTQSDTTSTAETTGSTTSRSDTWTISGTIQPSTQAGFTQSAATAQGSVAFNCPAEFQYKVAILSLCGDYSGTLPYRSVNVKHCGVCRVFGEGNGDAMADLEGRLNKPGTDNFNMNFDDEKNYYKMQKSDVTDHRFYSSVGGKNTFVSKQNVSSAAALTPLGPLYKTSVPADKASMTIHYSTKDPTKNRISLTTLPVEGSALLKGKGRKLAPYYGFSSEYGEWRMVDMDGNEIEDSEFAEIKSTPIGDFLVAKQISGQPLYLQYFIEDGVYPKDPMSDAEEYLTNSDLKRSAVIEVYIFDGGDSGTGAAGNRPVYLNKLGKNPDALVYLDDDVWIVPTFDADGAWKVTGIKSSKKSVAEVLRDGQLKLKKTGSVTITVTAKKGKKKATATVKLIIGKPGVPLGLQINQGEEVFTLGLKDEGIQLTAISLPNYSVTDKVKWSSSKESVVKVDKNGVLTPVKTGTAKITATSTQNKKAKATITIKVVKGKVVHNGILDLEDDDTTADTQAPGSELEAPAAVPEAPAQSELPFEVESVANEASGSQEVAID